MAERGGQEIPVGFTDFLDAFLNIEQYRETIGLSQNLSSMGPQIPGFFLDINHLITEAPNLDLYANVVIGGIAVYPIVR